MDDERYHASTEMVEKGGQHVGTYPYYMTVMDLDTNHSVRLYIGSRTSRHKARRLLVAAIRAQIEYQRALREWQPPNSEEVAKLEKALGSAEE